MTRLGLGCNTLGSASHRLSRHQQIRLVHAAIDHDIRAFDTADAYGNGESERTLGDALAGRADSVTVVTKAGYHFTEHPTWKRLARRVVARTSAPLRARLRPGSDGGPGSGGSYAAQDFSASYVRQAAEGSCRRLRLERLDGLLLHGPAQVDEAAIAGLQELRSAGLVAAIGAGTETDDAAFAWAARDDIDLVELGVRPGDPTYVDRLRDRPAHVWVRGVVRGGIANDDADTVRRVDALARDLSMTPLGLDLAWIRQRLAPDVVLIGTSRIENLTAAANAFAESIPDDDALDRLEALRGHR